MKNRTRMLKISVRNSSKLLLLLAISALFYGCSINIPDPSKVYPLEEKTLSGEGADKILVLEIKGLISEDDESKGFGGQVINTVARVQEILTRAQKDRSVKAILLRVNSPGGEVTATDVIYNQLMEFKKKNSIPIIADITSVGASGAYYISMAADKVLARPTSVIGSIGVIIQGVNIVPMMEKIGMKSVTYKSGKFKDMGSPLKPVQDDETAILNQIVKEMHHRFLEVVSKGRKMEMRKVLNIGDGKVYTAQQSKENNMIDEIGYFSDAIALTQKTAGLESAKVVIYHRENEYKNNIHNNTGATNSLQLFGISLESALSKRPTSFLYQWMP